MPCQPSSMAFSSPLKALGVYWDLWHSKAFESFKILRSVGDGNGEVGGIGGVERERSGPDGVERLGLGGGEARIV